MKEGQTVGSDLRAIFSKHRITWIDKGPNCSKGNVNIACPFCKTDPSYHLAVSQEWRGYYCFRNPRHAGSVRYLFHVLGIPLSPYQTYFTPTPLPEGHKDFSLIRYFTPAEDSMEAVAYLRQRLFLDPATACTKFNLRIDIEGRWAGRLIIPLTVGWTGRAMRSHINPRYLAETDETGFFFYSNNSSSAFVVEGAIDAMRLVSASEQFDVLGKCGNKLSPSLLLHLRKSNYLTIYNLPDSTVPIHDKQHDSRVLASYCTRAKVLRPELPTGRKDLGEMTEGETRLWLMNLGNICSRTGQARGGNGRLTIV